jgi:hypothetical protein
MIHEASSQLTISDGGLDALAATFNQRKKEVLETISQWPIYRTESGPGWLIASAIAPLASTTCNRVQNTLTHIMTQS